MHIVGFDKGVYEQERQMLFSQIKELPELVIIASDISTDAINVSLTDAPDFLETTTLSCI